MTEQIIHDLKDKKNIRRVLLVRPVSAIIHSAGHARDIRVPFLLKYIEALLLKNNDYDVRLVDCLINPVSLDGLVELTAGYSPDLVIVSSTTLERGMTLEYARMVKRESDPVIMVIGQDASARPEGYVCESSPVDIVVRGEPESATLQLLEALNGRQDISRIRGVNTKYFRHPDLALEKDLDALPFPDYSPDDFKKYIFYYPLPIAEKTVWAHMLTSRGCPYDCVFCSQVMRESFGKEVRLRDPAKVADEMEFLKKKGATIIAFDDDNFTTSERHVYAICQELKKRKLKIKWTAHARVDNCSRALLEAMKDAGCILLRFGIESGSERIIKALKKATCDGWAEKAVAVFEQARNIDLATVAIFSIGTPSETREDIDKSISLAKKLKADILQICFFTPYPGAPLYERYKEEILTQDTEKMYHYSIPLINFSAIPKEELGGLYRAFYREIMLRPGFLIRHCLRYWLFYLFNAKVFFRLFSMRTLLFGER